MIDRVKNIVGDRDFVPSLLRAALLIILLFILFLTPTFELGTELAVFSATLAIVILSLLSAHYSEERTELIREQNDLIESQIGILEEIEERNQEQTVVLQGLDSESDVRYVDREKDEEQDEGEVEKETTD